MQWRQLDTLRHRDTELSLRFIGGAINGLFSSTVTVQKPPSAPGTVRYRERPALGPPGF